MSDDWSRFVRVIRADGEERTVPVAAWSDDLAERVLGLGGEFIHPDDEAAPEAKPPPPPPPMKQSPDADLVLKLLNVESGLTPWELEFAESLAKWLDENDTLTNKQRAKAEQILAELGERSS